MRTMRDRHRLRGAWAALLLMALAACEPSAGPAELSFRETAEVVDPGEVVALTGGPATADRLTAGAAERGYVLERRDALAGFDLELMTFRLPPGVDGPAAIRELEALEPGTTVGLNHAYRAGPEAGDAGPRLYAEELLGWPEAGCPARVAVGIVDTALAPRTPELAGAEIVSRDFTGGGAEGADPHGVVVAEIIAGPGRLQGVRLFHAAVVGDVASGDTAAAGVDDIMRAVAWLDDAGVRLVNVSLAGPYNKILDRGLAAAAERGMIIVAAAGNDGLNSPPRYPAAFDFAIAVTAVDAELEAYRRAPRGGYIDFAAPGVDVYVPLGGGGRYVSGTSVAAPFVTAAIAADPAFGQLGSVGAVRARLAQATVDLGAAGPDETFGAGLARAPAACRGLIRIGSHFAASAQ